MKKTLAAACIATGIAACLALTGALTTSAQAAPTVAVDPGRLDRGPDPTIPHLEGSILVDGDRRIRLKGRNLTLDGTSGAAYLVSSTNRRGTRHLTRRVRGDGRSTVLLRDRTPYRLTVSGDGVHLVRSLTDPGPARTRVQVFDARSGTRVAQRGFDGFLSVLDMEEGRMVLGGWAPNRSLWWNALSNATQTIKGKAAYAADITGDRLASYTRDPVRGGCTLLTRLSKPGQRLWRSCDQRVDSFSPQGQRMLTIPILTDGLGARVLQERARRGRLFATYRVSGHFGQPAWELESDFVVEAVATRKATTVRCSGGGCERAGKLRRSPLR